MRGVPRETPEILALVPKSTHQPPAAPRALLQIRAVGPPAVLCGGGRHFARSCSRRSAWCPLEHPTARRGGPRHPLLSCRTALCASPGYPRRRSPPSCAPPCCTPRPAECGCDRIAKVGGVRVCAGGEGVTLHVSKARVSDFASSSQSSGIERSNFFANASFASTESVEAPYS